MNLACKNNCAKPPSFPHKLANRPGLSHFQYRIGTYSGMLTAMLRALDSDTNLYAWTHRQPDDPGIALLEGAAILGDILTFYQELYANEAFLRTANWRESIADLLRLTGILLRPGLGGSATFAFIISGTEPLIIPAHFPLKAQVTGLTQPTDYESLAEAIAYPALSSFRLYRPRRSRRQITPGMRRLEITAAEGSADPSLIQAVGIRPGDHLLLVPETSMFDANGPAHEAQKPPEIVIVSDVEHILDRTVLTLEGAVVGNHGSEVTAYRIGRRFRHFGYNLPSPAPLVAGALTASMAATYRYAESASDSTPTEVTDLHASLLTMVIALNGEIDDLAAGAKIACQGWATFDQKTDGARFTVIREIKSIQADTRERGYFCGPVTLLTLNSKIIANTKITNIKYDLHRLVLHEITSPKLSVQAATVWEDGNFNARKLFYYGLCEDAAHLAGRPLLFVHDDGCSERLTVISQEDDFQKSGTSDTRPKRWEITLNRKPSLFRLEDFDEVAPLVTVHGNLVEADQGKTEAEAVLGSGDNRQIFQTFEIPKQPLTYHLADGEIPQAPQLQIYVNDRLWKCVSAFFGHQAEEEIYIVREDAGGRSWVQFGDGRTGKRLPSGLNNIIIRYRTGIGVYGALEEQTTVQAGVRLNRLDKILMPGTASGGAQPENGEYARMAAPGKIQSLGRFVSLKDFESEALGISGVAKAAAVLDLVENIPTVVVTLLMETAHEQEIEVVQEILNRANRCRGARRFPLKTRQGRHSYIALTADISFNPKFREDTVRKEIQAALGVSGLEGATASGSQGLFAISQRTFGQNEYQTRITGVIQQVEGVRWAKVTGFSSLGAADDPENLMLSGDIKANSVVTCDRLHILCLYKKHLSLYGVAAAAEVC